jgi:hypothetical protein
MKNLKFKGGRNYVQGPDILEEVCRAVLSGDPYASDFDIHFHRRIDRQLKIVDESSIQNLSPAVVCSYTSGTIKKKIFLCESDEEVNKRCEYDEEAIIKNIVVDSKGKSCTLLATTNHLNFEIWVAMVKKLHQTIFPGQSGKWLFVRSKFGKYYPEVVKGPITAILVTNLFNKYTKSNIFIKGQMLAEIHFYLDEK